MRRAWILSVLALGCEAPVPEAPPAEREPPSPNASILPAPLASAPPPTVTRPAPTSGRPTASSTSKTAPLSSGEAARPASSARLELPPAEPLRADTVLPTDAVSVRDAAGLLLVAEWRWPDAPAPPRTPEVFAEGIASARRLTSFKWLLTLSDGGRLRALFDTRAFPLPLGSELRARADRLGHALVFPGGNEYRTAPPGSLRSLFGDRRLDVMPLVSGEPIARGPLPSRFGLPVRRVELQARLGAVTLDLMQLTEPSQGAALLCRTLVELAAVDPASSLCSPRELPLRAQFSWRSGSGVVFEVQDLLRRPELPVGDLACPPLGASPSSTVLPPQTSGVLLTRDEASAFRQRPIEVTPAAGAPFDGILARNATDSLRYLLVDGVPVAWVLPGQEVTVTGFPRGRYVVQWRSFLGDMIEAPRVIDVPARVAVGEVAPEPPPAPARSAH